MNPPTDRNPLSPDNSLAGGFSMRWGVFMWTAQNRYPLANAIGKTYKYRHAAEKACLKISADGSGVCVRSIAVPTVNGKAVR